MRGRLCLVKEALPPDELLERAPGAGAPDILGQSLVPDERPPWRVARCEALCDLSGEVVEGAFDLLPRHPPTCP